MPTVQTTTMKQNLWDAAANQSAAV